MNEQHIRELMRRAFTLGYQIGSTTENVQDFSITPIVSDKVLNKIIVKYNEERRVR